MNATSPLPREPLPGPLGAQARVGTIEDAKDLVDLYVAALKEARRPHRADLVDWVVQAVLHDPLRGLCVLADKPASAGPPPPADSPRHAIGVAVFEASATAEHGWAARLSCLYVTPEMRHHGVGKWLLGEALEFARYYGLNHVVFEARPEDAQVASLLAAAGLRSHPVSHYRIDLPPLYDEP